MAGEMQIRARIVSGDVAEVKVLLIHDMETGLRKDAKTKNVVPAHFINQVVATLNGKTVLESQWGTGVAKNPFLGFRVKGAKPGDFIAISAVDNTGAKFDNNAIVI